MDGAGTAAVLESPLDLGLGSVGAPPDAPGMALPLRGLCEPFKLFARQQDRAPPWMRLLQPGKKWRFEPAFRALFLRRTRLTRRAHTSSAAALTCGRCAVLLLLLLRRAR